MSELRTALAGLALIFSTASVDGVAQRLYDSDRDTRAKQGADAATKLASGDLWEKMARNLDKLSREDIHTYLLDQQLRMRATIDNMTTWAQVDAIVDNVGRTLGAEGSLKPEEIAARRDEVRRRREELDTQMQRAIEAQEALRKHHTTVPPVLQPVFENLGDIHDAVQQLQGVAGSGEAGVLADRLVEAVAALQQIQSVFEVADQGLKQVNAVRAQLGGLDLEIERTVLLRLRADEEHFKNQAAIIARRAEEERGLLRILQDYRARRQRISVAPQDSVPDSLLRAAAAGSDTNRDAVYDRARALYDAAALAARGDTPAALASLRLAEEEQRYSIRKSAAEARAYEQLVSTGLRRLALFYAGGTRPETVAQLLFNALSLANLGYLTYAK